MKCARCDHDLPQSDRFCGRCGLSRSTDGKPVDPLLGIIVADRYRIERRIGVGGMGTVYLGSHRRIGQKVAVKVLHERHASDAQLTLRFENEALTYGRVNHPNLVSLHDFGRTPDGMFFMVLEYCPGRSLSQQLRNAQRLDPALAVDVVTQIAQGLAAAHAVGIVHRDLKPENVILMDSRPGRYHVKLLDFGIAKSVNDDGPRLTQAGMVFGTPEYMSPEQARGQAVDARSDIYALGAMLYELLSGRPPFHGSNKMQVMHCQASELPTPLQEKFPDLPDALCAVVLKCLEKLPKDRYESADALINALDGALGADRLTPLPLPSMVEDPFESEGTEGRISAPWARGSGLQSEPYQLNTDPYPDDEPGLTDALMHASGLYRSPSPMALAAIALVLCGSVALAAWFAREPGTAETDLGPVATVPQEAQPEPKRVATPPNPEPEPAPVVAEKPTPKPKRTKKAAVVPAPAPKAAPRPRKAKKRTRAVVKVAEEKAPPIIRKKKRADVGAEVATAKKALKQGEFSGARAAIEKALEADPGHKGARKLRKRLNETQRALALGRLAYDGADCEKTIETLERVLRVSPGAKNASTMVASCRDGMPPVTL